MVLHRTGLARFNPQEGHVICYGLAWGAALLYTYIKGGDGQGLNSLVHCYLRMISYAKSTVE